MSPIPVVGVGVQGGSGFGFVPGTGYGPPNTGPSTPSARTATASSAHDMLKAVMLELGFVVVATMLAGISDSWGTAMLALMLALLVLRGLFQVDIFAAFAQGTSLHPT